MENDDKPAIILIVEDDLVLGRVLAHVLRSETRRTVRVGDSRRVLDLVQAYQPRLLLLDAQLRDGTAATLLEALSERHPALPVILLAAHRLDRSNLRGHAHRVVTKSISLKELREFVDGALGVGTACSRDATNDPDRVSRPLPSTQLFLHAVATNR